ncbi:unnamed protein product [Polarella glacialis]|uniref:Uncharacterized protein n=1 Tax=Polarella glacialis TaxID=89957 RepID=A0A813DCL8_POLGL|nr:unnamed protein product [Polarella glacialis]
MAQPPSEQKSWQGFEVCGCVPPRAGAVCAAFLLLTSQCGGWLVQAYRVFFLGVPTGLPSRFEMPLLVCFLLYSVLIGIAGVLGLIAAYQNTESSAVRFFNMSLHTLKLGVLLMIIYTICTFASGGVSAGLWCLLSFVVEYGFLAFLLKVIWNWVRFLYLSARGQSAA